MPTGIYFKTDEHKRKLSESAKGRQHTKETKRKMSETQKRIGNKPPSQEGKHRSEETKRKISRLKMGRKLSDETKRKLIEASKGRKSPMEGKHHSKETREKMSKAKTGKKHPKWKGGISKDIDHIRLQRCIYSAKRRSIKKEISGTIAIGEWELLKKQYGFKCPICNKKEPKIKLTIDHIIPLSKGGSNFIENIQPLCNLCNSRKHQKAFKINKKGQFEFIFK